MLHTDTYRGTMREQIEYRYAEKHARSAASCMVILGHSRRNRQYISLFPYHFIYRTEEITV